MMYLVYLLPVVFIVGGLIYSQLARKNIQAQLAAGNGPELFHNGFAHYFSALNDGEHLVSVWMGTAYTGETSTVTAAAKGLANVVSAHAIGVSTYVPQVFVGITTLGRLLIAEEYSELGQRGNYRTVRCWAPGSTASTQPPANGVPPKGPDGQPIILSTVHAPDGESYTAWLALHGHELMHQTGRSVSQALPTTAEQCQARWVASRQALQSVATGAQA